MKHIVILGGGFGGVYTLKHLLQFARQRQDIEVTLVNKTNYFLFTPMLHEVATGGLTKQTVAEPIKDVFNEENVKIITAEAKTIDFPKKQIATTKGAINYDYLVIAIGSETNYYGIPGAKENSLALKTIEHAELIRNKILESIEKGDLSCAIIGAGPTGIELAGEMAQFVRHAKAKDFKIYLIQRGDKIMPTINDEYCRQRTMAELKKKGVTVMLNSNVTKVEKDGIEIDGNKKLKTGTVVWTSGIKPREIETKPKTIDEKGFFQVDNHLQVKGVKDVFAIGDCALAYNEGENKPVPQLAQSAIKQAKAAAENIIAIIDGKPLQKFNFTMSGFLVSVGQWFAVAEIKGIKFKGRFAWWLWRTIYLTKILGLRNKARVAMEWTVNLLFPRNASRV